MGLTCASFHVHDRPARTVREVLTTLLEGQDVVAFVSPMRRAWVSVVVPLDAAEGLAAAVAAQLEALVFSIAVFDSDVLGYTLREGTSVLDLFLSRGESSEHACGRAEAFSKILDRKGQDAWARLIDRREPLVLEDDRLTGMARVLGLGGVSVTHGDFMAGDGARSFRRVGAPTLEERRQALAVRELDAWREAARKDGVLVADWRGDWLAGASPFGFAPSDDFPTTGDYRAVGSPRLATLEHVPSGTVWTAEELHSARPLRLHPRGDAVVAACGANGSVLLVLRGVTRGLLMPGGGGRVNSMPWAKDRVREVIWAHGGRWLVVLCERSLRAYDWDRLHLNDGVLSEPDVHILGWFVGVADGPDGGLWVATGASDLSVLSLPDGRLGPSLARLPLAARPWVLRRSNDGRFLAWSANVFSRAHNGEWSHFVVDASRLPGPGSPALWVGLMPARDRIAELIVMLGDEATDVLLFVAYRPFPVGVGDAEIAAWEQRFGRMPPALELLVRLWEGGAGDVRFALRPLEQHEWASADEVRMGHCFPLDAYVSPATGAVRAGLTRHPSLAAYLRSTFPERRAAR